MPTARACTRSPTPRARLGGVGHSRDSASRPVSGCHRLESQPEGHAGRHEAPATATRLGLGAYRCTRVTHRLARALAESAGPPWTDEGTVPAARGWPASG